MKIELYSDDLLLYASYDNIHNATSIVLTEQVNTTNNLEFTLPFNNPNIDNVTKLASVITLYEDEVLVFEGRVLYTEDDIIKNRTFSCEGSLAYLLDSIQRPKEYHDTTIRSYLEDKINNHNMQVEENKRFTVGRVTVTNSTDNAYRIDNDYPTTLENINDKLIERLGGYLIVRKDNNTRYLDYVENYGVESKQVIEFKKNILDLTNHVSAENVVTALIPLGVKDEETDLPLTIEKVNNGKDYVHDENAVNLFGWIYSKTEYDDITLPENLKRQGEEDLKANIKASISIEVTAFDLSLVDVDVDKINLGDSVRVVSKHHSIDDYFIVKNREKNYLEPKDSKICLETVIKKNTDKVNSVEKQLDSIKQQDKNKFLEVIKQQTNLITGGKGGHMQYGFNDSNLPSEIYFLDNQNKELAKKVLRINKNGIGFSKNGIDGPYETAWTLDGSFNASYITSGTLQGVQLIAELGYIGGWALDKTSISSGGKVGIVLDSEERSVSTYNEETEFIGMKLYDGGLAIYSYFNNGTYVGQLASGKDGIVLQGANGSKVALGIAKDDSSSSLDGYIVYGGDSVSVYKNLNMNGHSITNQSDVRLKKNINDVSCNFIYDLDIKVFDYIKGDNNVIGIIANDYIDKDYAKYFVSTDENGYCNVNYQNINNALIKCVQEQNKRIEALERKMK